MNIMHYSLGLPPLRSGGLTKYFYDLVKNSHGYKDINNIIVFPIKKIFIKSKYIKSKNKDTDIDCYEMVTPVTIPVVFGIRNPDMYLGDLKNSEEIHHINFFEKNKIELIHLHTLMGLTYGFFRAARKKKIKIIYSTHDYFGICPKTTLFNKKNIHCENFNQGIECVNCNKDALSDTKLLLSQNMYLKYINKRVSKKLQKEINLEYFENDISKSKEEISKEEISKEEIHKAEIFKKIRQSYLFIFENYIDHIHYNSESTKEVFSNYIGIKKNRVVSITHKSIDFLKRKNNELNVENKNILHLIYLGPYNKQKGLYDLIGSLKKISHLDNWKLNVYGDEKNISLPDTLKSKVIINGRYKVEQLPQILNQNDMLIVPSLSKETFGFTTLEALAMNIPVLISKNVGAKDLIKSSYPDFIYENEQDLLDKILYYTKKKLDLKKIQFNDLILDYDDHLEEIKSMYDEVIFNA